MSFLDPWLSFRAEVVWWHTSALFLMLFAVTLIFQRLDPRQIDRESVWAKPLKFEAALALHFATLALVTRWLSEAARGSGLLAFVALASLAAAVFEIGYILWRAARAERSHFNRSTPLAAMFYAVMAAGAVVITAAAGVVGTLALAMPGSEMPGEATRIGAGLGLVGGALLTLVIAFRMGAAMSHHVGAEPRDGKRMALTGWSLVVGDRRVPHFLATHMMQTIPFAGLVLDQFSSGWSAIAMIGGVSLAWTALTLGAFAQANAGLPLSFDRGAPD